MGVFDLVGTTASGWLSDRWDNRWLLFWYYGLRGAALLYLPAAFGIEVFGLPLFAVFYGLDWIATVPPTVRLTTDAVGPDDGPIVFGWIVAAHQIGAGLGALGAGVVRTELSTYTAAWVTAGLICMVAAVMVLGIGRSPRRLSATVWTDDRDALAPSNRGGRAGLLKIRYRTFYAAWLTAGTVLTTSRPSAIMCTWSGPSA
jgi:predicted MFS family arabinose efflux permease